MTRQYKQCKLKCKENVTVQKYSSSEQFPFDECSSENRQIAVPNKREIQ